MYSTSSALAFSSPPYSSYRVRVMPCPGTNGSSALNGPLPMGCSPKPSGSSKKACGSGKNAVDPTLVGHCAYGELSVRVSALSSAPRGPLPHALRAVKEGLRHREERRVPDLGRPLRVRRAELDRERQVVDDLQ